MGNGRGVRMTDGCNDGWMPLITEEREYYTNNCLLGTVSLNLN